MNDYHEPLEQMGQETHHMTQALNSLKEEIEAIDWYNQRLAVAENDSLKAILEHNRNEEIEHACMAIEWLRRNMPMWDKHLHTYIFTVGDITNQEPEAEPEDEASGLKIGKIK